MGNKWSAFTQCSKTCDGGIKKRTRSCNNRYTRLPTEKGCPGIAVQEQICNSISCRLALTELGETCKERGWLPISSLAECNASTEYFQKYYPSYVFREEVDRSWESKGCYVFMYPSQPEGYFNTHDSVKGCMFCSHS